MYELQYNTVTTLQLPLSNEYKTKSRVHATRNKSQPSSHRKLRNLGQRAAMEAEPHRLLAAIDMGTNSFKLLIAQAQTSTCRFIPIDRLSSPVVLGRNNRRRSSDDGGDDGDNRSLSPSSIYRSLSALRSFSLLLVSRRRPLTRVVATAAVRAAPNRARLVELARSQLGLDIEVLSGHDEARLVYLGLLQFLPVLDRRVLAVDIGGGSTELILGHKGRVLFSASLDLGHVTLTDSFNKQFTELRRHVRTVLDKSGVVEKVKEIGFEVAVGSSGTVKAIEKAISGSDFGRKWRFSRDELESVVDKITDFEWLGLEGVKRLGLSRRRSEFIAAGAILLAEIFEALGIQEMEVSGYALGEGVIAEMMMTENHSNSNAEFDLCANARWRSVVALAVRFDVENRMKSMVQCVGIAKDIFYGIRRCGVLSEDRSESLVCLDEKDFEYIEAAILLHNVGRVIGKKGYHKCSYHIIKDGGHLHGCSSEQIELIALLARFHRKKFPKCEHASLQGLPVEMKEKFRVLCIIVRLSLGLHQCQCKFFNGLEVVHTPEGFKLVIRRFEEQLLDPCGVHWTSTAVEAALRLELEHFEEVFQEKISVIIS